MDVGCIGLGTMGSRIAANLLKAGHKVRAWNRSRPAVDALAKLGATPAATAREAFSGDAVFSMLADDAAVRQVIEPLLDGAPRTRPRQHRHHLRRTRARAGGATPRSWSLLRRGDRLRPS